MPKVFLSIGSNIDRERNIRSSLDSLGRVFGAIQQSGIYESAAVGFEGNAFYNVAVSYDSDLPIREIAKILRDIEIKHGRDPSCEKFSARTLDLDLILYGDAVLTEGNITVPRTDILNYAFVLEPLAEIAPDLKHPVVNKTYAELWAKFDKNGLHQHRL